jgi:hypothetical protein
MGHLRVVDQAGQVMKITTVDQFLKQKVLPEHRDIVALLRRIMRELAPGAYELVTYGILAWRGNNILAVVSPTKKDITFSFSHGADFEDKYGLLQGVGRVSKHVKIADVKEINKPALRYYIKQALKFDKMKK